MEKKLQGDLIKVENDIYLTETKYLKLTSQSGGNVFKGWEGQGQGTKTTSIAAVTGSHRRQNRILNNEKFFTLSSLSAPQDDDHQKSK